MCLSVRLSFFLASLRRPTVFAPPLSHVLIFRLFFSLAPHTAFIGTPLSSADAPVLFSETPLLFRRTHFSRHSTPNAYMTAVKTATPLSPPSPSSPRRYHRHYRQGCHHCHRRSRSCSREVAAACAHLQRRLRSAAAAAAQLQRGGLCEAHRIFARQFSPPCGCALGPGQRLSAAANYSD